MKVRYREGLATHPDPKSCAYVREEIGEALTGADASRVLSREIGPSTLGCLRSQDERGATPDAPLPRGTFGPCAVRDPVRASKHTSRKTGGPMVGPRWMALWPVPGILREYDGDKRPWEVGQFHNTREASEQGRWCTTVRGGSRGKGAGQRESGSAKQVPYTEAER